MYVMIWEFFVRSASQKEFEGIYGPSGDWARLFASSPGYQGTELLADSEQAGEGGRRYVTIAGGVPRWTWPTFNPRAARNIRNSMRGVSS
jgi:hypothetical protein